jgi:hypothetical protein
LDDPHFIPEADRAVGEPGERGCWRDVAEEQESKTTAPDVLASCEMRLLELPRLAAERRWSWETGIQRFNPNARADVIRELRAPLKQHFNSQLRAGKWACFGFSEACGERVRISSAWRDGISFDDTGGMTDERGHRYSDVLFYLTAGGVSGASGAHVQSSGKPDPRNKSEAMVEGLEKALVIGSLGQGRRASLKEAHNAMLDAMGFRDAPAGMGYDAFAKHCKSWLRKYRIYC